MNTARKPEVTLIVSSSVDGCLIGRDSDELDHQKNWKNSPIVRGVIQQFYDFANNEDIYNLTTASTMISLGLNNDDFSSKKDAVNLIVLDLLDEVTSTGVTRLAASVDQLILLSGSKRRDLVRKSLPKNCRVLAIGPDIFPTKIMELLKKKYGVTKITIQSAGQLNTQWLDANVVDYLTIIVYPLVVSQNGAPTFPEGKTVREMVVKPLQLIAAQIFDTNYVSLRYKVVNT